MSEESVQPWLGRTRPPRILPTYNVEEDGARIKKVLGFLIGVIADLSGKPDQPLPNLKDRKFVEIDRDNFDDVLKGIGVGLEMKVNDVLTGKDDAKIPIKLAFKSMDDFNPERIVNQIEPLRKRLEVRQQLSALLAKADVNEKLNEELEHIMRNTELLQQIRQEEGYEAETNESENKEELEHE